MITKLDLSRKLLAALLLVVRSHLHALDLAQVSAKAVPTATGGLPGLYLQTVLAQWSSWEGSFVAFCEHLQREHGVPLGRSSIAKILEHAGERRPSKRRGRSPDERALRDAFISFFPGAVWVGDGSELVVELEGEHFRVNLELIVDAHSGAFVGLDVRAHEDSDAVIAAFDDGVDAAPTAPLSLLLDNKACNHKTLANDGAQLLDFVDRALAAERELECYFWLDVVADLARAQRVEQRRSIFDRVARRICTSFRVSPRRRQTAICVLGSLLLPTS